MINTNTPRCDYYKLDGYRGLIQMEYAKLFLDIRDVGVGTHLITDCSWEAEETALVRQIAAPGQIWIEIGANFGYYTVDLARLVGETGKIFSFEASPHLASFVTETIAVNGFKNIVNFYQKAVWDVNGEMIPFDTTNTAYIGGSHIYYSDDSEHIEKKGLIEVETVTLDDGLPSDLVADFLKMDVEGAECHILNGARDLIDRSHDIKIIMEWNVSLQNAAGSDVTQCIDQLVEQGFSFFEIKRTGSGILIPTTADDLINTKAHLDIYLERSAITNDHHTTEEISASDYYSHITYEL
jgi:FkbM family methyltransferase